MLEKEDLVAEVKEIHRLKGYTPKATASAAKDGNREPSLLGSGVRKVIPLHGKRMGCSVVWVGGRRVEGEEWRMEGGGWRVCGVGCGVWGVGCRVEGEGWRMKGGG